MQHLIWVCTVCLCTPFRVSRQWVQRPFWLLESPMAFWAVPGVNTGWYWFSTTASCLPVGCFLCKVKNMPGLSQMFFWGGWMHLHCRWLVFELSLISEVTCSMEGNLFHFKVVSILEAVNRQVTYVFISILHLKMAANSLRIHCSSIYESTCMLALAVTTKKLKCVSVYLEQHVDKII